MATDKLSGIAFAIAAAVGVVAVWTHHLSGNHLGLIAALGCVVVWAALAALYLVSRPSQSVTMNLCIFSVLQMAALAVAGETGLMLLTAGTIPFLGRAVRAV